MEFEYDPVKSAINKEKHGVDFEQAKLLWADITRVEIPTKNVKGESRFALVGGFGGTVWIAIYTLRGDKIRIISVRPASREERKLYEQADID